jgi:nitrate reductase NapAB chaperone NapD
VDGVTAENSQVCADRLQSKLEDRLPDYPGYRGFQLKQAGDQWYLMFHFDKDVSLADIDAALKGSAFSIPRDKLQIFGHATLIVDPRPTSTKNVLTALLTIDHASIAKLDDKDGLLSVTVDMPYPAETIVRDHWEKVASVSFQRSDLSSDRSTKSEPAINSASLPGYDTFRDVLAKQNAALKDIAWSPYYACRAVGAVSAKPSDRVTSAK